MILAAVLAFASAARAEDPPKEPPPPPPKPTFSFALHGFVGGSLYVQDALLAPSGGGNPMWASGQLTTDKIALGGDIRQTRLNFSLQGPPAIAGGTPKAVAEFDLFGGNSSGGFGDVSVWPRIRVAYAELAWPDTTIRIGQDYSLTVGINTLGGAFLPASVGHIAFPVTYAAGTIGWRYPGIFAYHRLSLGGDMKLELALEVARAGWLNPANPGSGTVAGTATAAGVVTGTATNLYFTPNADLGSASGLPQVEARVLFSMGKMFNAFIAGHWNNVDASGQGNAPYAPYCDISHKGSGCDDFQVLAFNGGVRVYVAGFTFQGSAYIGNNLSPLLGSLVQFPTLGAGDLSEWGAWGQVGYEITPDFSAWALIGTEQLDNTVARAAGLGNLGNVTSQGMLRYQVGGYALALEVTHWYTKRASGALIGFDGTQAMFSGFYFF